MHATGTTPEEYFAQGEYYFSHSQGGMIQIESMPLSYVKNAWSKLQQEYGSLFACSTLSFALLRRLHPDTHELEKVLRRTGEAAHHVNPGFIQERRNARNKFYRAGKRMGRRVTTHWEGNWVRGTCTPDVVNIRTKER